MKIAEIEEPWIEATILTPDEYLGAVLKLCQDRRGSQKELTYVGTRAMVIYELPLNEVVFDFYDRLKIVSKRLCLASTITIDRLRERRPRQDADPGQRRAGRCAVDAGAPRPAPKAAAAPWCEKLKELIPPHMFQIPIQAAIGGKIIARETVARAAQGRHRQMLRRRHHAASASCSTSRRKARSEMRQFGKVDIPQEAFIAALKVDS
ncbi:MAG: hypothetical protein MZV49_11655 [Rhodopseudomonas palustris]|nr:hypothetical protein [Rhodopseudomonas palustris]